MTRFISAGITLLAAVVALGGCGLQPAPDERPTATPEKPNIILIMADDIGYECYGSSGSTQYQTPNLDRMAADGVRFRRAYSQPLCTPSRIKIMTGKSNVRNYSAFSVLNRDQRTFGHMLRELGYRTMVAGKWQLLGAEHYPEQFRGKGTWPADAGFDRYCLWQVDKKGTRYWNPLLYIDGENKQFAPDDYGPDIVNDYVLKFIEQNKDRRFFAYYPMILVHNPFLPTPDSADRNSKDKQRNFEDMVAYMDKLIGRVVDKTKELGIAGKTMILYTGDNGTNRAIRSVLNGRTIQGGKGLTINAGDHVTLIGYWPGVFPPGRVEDDLIEFSDVAPTLLDATGTEAPPGLDGWSFLPQLRGEPGRPRDWIFTYYCPRPERTKPVRYAQDERWKLYGDNRLYEYRADLLEKSPLTNLDGNPEAAIAREKLAGALASMPAKGQTLLKFAP